MRPAEVVRRGADYLARHGVDQPRATSEVLLAHLLGTDRSGLYLRGTVLTAGEAKAFGRALCDRCTGAPAQHITGEQGFRRLVLEVRPGVFVPRPETEVLVEAASTRLGDGVARIVDVGTGTGAVALAIADEHPSAEVWATDSSPEAVALARTNAGRLGLEIRVLEGDLLEPLPDDLRGRLDLVVSNPPYLDPAEGAALPAEVRADPATALYGDLDGYVRLAEAARLWLRPGGSIVVEVDERRATEVRAALGTAGFGSLEVIEDLAGRDRIVTGRRP
jgi:release factor glutamine methyltransferase